MACLDIHYYTPVKIAALQALADDLPDYCGIPVEEGKAPKFCFDPMMLPDVEEVLKDAMYDELCKINKKTMPKSWRDAFGLNYNEYNFDEDLIEYDIEFDDESQSYATVTIQLQTKYKNWELKNRFENPVEINLLNMELDEILINPAPHHFYNQGELLKHMYFENEDYWRQKLIRYVILNYLTD